MEKKMGPGVGNNFFHIEKTDFKEQTLFCKIGSLFFVIFLFHTKQRTDTSDKNQVNEAVGLSFFFISWTITCLDGLILTNTCRKNTDREAIHFHFQERNYPGITNWLHA